MCTVSNIGDGFRDNFQQRFPWADPITPWQIPTGVLREEFERLKQEVKALKELLEAAKKYDEITGQKDCEMDVKVELLKKIAEAVGVDLKSVFK